MIRVGEGAGTMMHVPLPKGVGWDNVYRALLRNVMSCSKLPSYVPYKGTYVLYNGTYGASDQGQTLDV